MGRQAGGSITLLTSRDTQIPTAEEAAAPRPSASAVPDDSSNDPGRAIAGCCVRAAEWRSFECTGSRLASSVVSCPLADWLVYICFPSRLLIFLFLEETQFLLLHSDLSARGGVQFPIMLTFLNHLLLFILLVCLADSFNVNSRKLCPVLLLLMISSWKIPFGFGRCDCVVLLLESFAS